MEYYKSQSPLYQFATDTVSKDGDTDFIFFDEPAEEEVANLRFIYATFIDASQGNMKSLYCFLCLFAGMTLRETSKKAGVSHETVRKYALQIKDKHPELYEVMTDKKAGLVASLIPTKRYKYVITNVITGKKIYLTNYHDFIRINNITKSDFFYYAKSRNPINNKYLIEHKDSSVIKANKYYEWKIEYENGEVEKVHYLNQFARDNGYNSSTLHRYFKLGKKYKGMKITRTVVWIENGDKK